MFLLLSPLTRHCNYLENTDEQVLKKHIFRIKLTVGQRNSRIVQYECNKLFLTLAINLARIVKLESLRHENIHS